MSFFKLFEKKKRALKDISLDDLKREQLSLQQEQRKLDLEAERLDKQESQLSVEYGLAESNTQKTAIARKVQNSRLQQKAVATKATHCHKLMQTVNNVALIRDNMSFYERMGVASELMQMDMSEIETFMSNAMIDGQLQQDKLASMLQQVADVTDQVFDSSGDDSLAAIISEMDEKTADTAVAERGSARAIYDDDVAAVMNDLNAAADKGERIAKQLHSQPDSSE